MADAKDLRAVADRILGRSGVSSFMGVGYPQGDKSLLSRADVGQYLGWLGRGGGFGELYRKEIDRYQSNPDEYWSWPEISSANGMTKSQYEGAVNFAMDLVSPMKVGGLLGMLAGPLAKTANPVARQLAEQMKSQGKTDEEIWRATAEQYGQPWWLSHPDQVPRFEISDELSQVTPYIMKGDVEGDIARHLGIKAIGKDPNEAIMMHPGLQEAYPQFADIAASGRIRTAFDDSMGVPKDVKGGYSPDVGLVLNVAPKDVRTTALHELQHAIQRMEGMSPGGSYRQLLQKHEQAQSGYQGMLDYVNDLYERRMAWRQGNPKGVDALKTENDWKEAIEEAESLLSASKTEVDASDPLKKYRSLGGEMEARAVERRMEMTPEQRANRPFWMDYDLPMSEMTIR